MEVVLSSKKKGTINEHPTFWKYNNTYVLFWFIFGVTVHSNVDTVFQILPLCIHFCFFLFSVKILLFVSNVLNGYTNNILQRNDFWLVPVFSDVRKQCNV